MEKKKEKKLSLSRYYRMGDNRGKEGNSIIKRMLNSRKKRVRPFKSARHYHKGIKTNLLSDLMAEHLGEGRYRVTFSNKPLKGKIFNAIVLNHYEEEKRLVGNKLVTKLDGLQASFQHIIREITRLEGSLSEMFERGGLWYKKSLNPDGEGEIEENVTEEYESIKKRLEAYDNQKESIIKQINVIAKNAKRYGSQVVHYPKAKYKIMRLKIDEVVNYDSEFDSWECTASPVTRITKTMRKYHNINANNIPSGVLNWLTKNNLLSIVSQPE